MDVREIRLPRLWKIWCTTHNVQQFVNDCDFIQDHRSLRSCSQWIRQMRKTFRKTIRLQSVRKTIQDMMTTTTGLSLRISLRNRFSSLHYSRFRIRLRKRRRSRLSKNNRFSDHSLRDDFSLGSRHHRLSDPRPRFRPGLRDWLLCHIQPHLHGISVHNDPSIRGLDFSLTKARGKDYHSLAWVHHPG
jgi:hypothetical protein